MTREEQLMKFENAFYAYCNGNVIQSPDGTLYHQKSKKLDYVKAELVLKLWLVIYPKKVNKYIFVYKNCGKYSVSEKHFETEQECYIWLHYVMGANIEIICRIDESKKGFERY